jgi:competence protein ComEA
VTPATAKLAAMPTEISPKLVVIALAALAILVIGWEHQQGSSGSDQSSYSSGYSSDAGSQPSADPPATTDPVVLVVDVAGAVRHPGVYRLPAGARVLDAVKHARPLPEADVSAVNLAARLTDGEQVVVPRKGQAIVAAGGGGTGATPSAPVSLNSGTLEQLETLDGIGPSLAQRIIDYRTAHGGFRSIADLDQVSGIGPARLAALRGHVTL